MAICLGEVVEPPDFMLTRPMGEPVFGIQKPTRCAPKELIRAQNR